MEYGGCGLHLQAGWMMGAVGCISWLSRQREAVDEWASVDLNPTEVTLESSIFSPHTHTHTLTLQHTHTLTCFSSLNALRCTSAGGRLYKITLLMVQEHTHTHTHTQHTHTPTRVSYLNALRCTYAGGRLYKITFLMVQDHTHTHTHTQHPHTRPST